MEYRDIDGRIVEIGDLIIISHQSYLSRHIYLGSTNKRIIISKVKATASRRSNDGIIEWQYHVNSYDLSRHNTGFKRYPTDCYIAEKNYGVPENLKKFAKY